MGEWRNPFISIKWASFWLLIQFLTDQVRIEREVRESLNGRKRK